VSFCLSGVGSSFLFLCGVRPCSCPGNKAVFQKTPSAFGSSTPHHNSYGGCGGYGGVMDFMACVVAGFLPSGSMDLENTITSFIDHFLSPVEEESFLYELLRQIKQKDRNGISLQRIE